MRESDPEGPIQGPEAGPAVSLCVDRELLPEPAGPAPGGSGGERGGGERSI